VSGDSDLRADNRSILLVEWSYRQNQTICEAWTESRGRRDNVSESGIGMED